MSLRKKLLIIFLIISNIPILIFTVFTYQRYTKMMNQQLTELVENTMTRAADEADRTLNTINLIQKSINYDSNKQDSLLENLHQYMGTTSYSAYDVYETNLLLQSCTQTFFQAYPYINGIFIFTPSGEILGNGNQIDIDYSYSPMEDEWFQKTLELKGSNYIDGITKKSFLLNSSPSISFSSMLSDVYTKEFLGVLYIDCSADLFDLSRVNTMPETVYLTLSKDKNILYTNGTPIPENANQKNLIHYSRALDTDDLILTGTFNKTQLNQESSYTLYLLVFMCFTCILIFLVLSILLSNNITKPIRLLSSRMAKHDTGYRVANEPYMNRSDEIGILYNEYENMIEELDQYIKNELQNKLLTLNSQMRSLEAQINAHFLYNTLEAISSLAAIEEVPDISTMAESLSSMFRYSIKTKSELVTLREELDHVHHYIAIQQIRFDNGFSVYYHIPEEYYEIHVLKLILQPLVENALYHGLQSCNYGSRIDISASIENQILTLSVRDDGIGMTEEQLNSLLNLLTDQVDFSELGYQNKQSIGIKNIHSRISLYYGSEYGLHVSSTKGKGSIFTLTLPVL